MENTSLTTDHDLLIEVNTLLKYSIRQVDALTIELKSQGDNKVSKEEFSKLTDDHEKRLRVLEDYKQNMMGRNAIISFLVTIGVTIIMWLLKIKV